MFQREIHGFTFVTIISVLLNEIFPHDSSTLKGLYQPPVDSPRFSDDFAN